MAKRLFSSDKRSEEILSHLRSNGENVSGYINNAVLDETLPVYSELRINALYLLDYMIDGAKDWTGNKLILAESEDELQFYTRQTLGRGVSWLKKGHHIKNGKNILQEIVSHYHENPWNGGISLDTAVEQVKYDIDCAQEKLKEIDPDYKSYYVGLGSTARDVLAHWDALWDWDGAYDIVLSTIYCEKPFGKIDPYFAIRMLQRMENQFIIEAIGTRQ